jgi:ABC-type bacteriocin/lantibiotic exporter with double-glycine peptidase domain
VASERLSAVRTVKLCNGEAREQAVFDAKVEQVYDVSRQMAVASGINMGMVSLGVNASLLAVLYRGGTLVLENQLSVGDLVRTRDRHGCG